MNARLILDPARAAAWNMAVDEALLRNCSRPTLRFYSWNAPSLSLGYFQSLADRNLHPASAERPVVRRSTGGGAIVHDRELTYSFTCPEPLAAKDGKAWKTADLYGVFHEALIACLHEHGVTARSATAKKNDEPAFLCFQRREAGDVLLGDRKIAGSAQRRRHGSLLQHGSVLLRRSEFAPELPGIFDLSNSTFESRQIIERWTSLVANALGLKFAIEPLTAIEREQATTISDEVFTHPSWISRR